jgi:hypothetical protein
MSDTTPSPVAPSKPGTVTTVSVDFDAFTAPIVLTSRKMGGTMMPVGGTGEHAMCYKAQQWSSGAEGNLNARWRRRMRRRKSGVSSARGTTT